MQEFARSPYRYVAARVWEAVMAGRSPILDRTRVAEDNALDRLHLGILPWGTRSRNPLNPETLAVLAMVPSAWQIAQRRVLLEYLRQHLEELRPFRRRADVGADRIDATAVGQ